MILFPSLLRLAAPPQGQSWLLPAGFYPTASPLGLTDPKSQTLLPAIKSPTAGNPLPALLPPYHQPFPSTREGSEACSQPPRIPHTPFLFSTAIYFSLKAFWGRAPHPLPWGSTRTAPLARRLGRPRSPLPGREKGRERAWRERGSTFFAS